MGTIKERESARSQTEHTKYLPLRFQLRTVPKSERISGIDNKQYTGYIDKQKVISLYNTI